MAFIDITSVERVESAGSELLAWGIDLPLTVRTEGYFLTVAGWLVLRNRSVESVNLRLADGVFVNCGQLDLLRPDVIEHLQLAEEVPTGFEIRLNVISLPPTFELRVEAKLAGDAKDGGTVMALIRGQHSRPHSSFRPSLQPLSLTSLGRTGTTLLIQMLVRHPEIMTRNVFPYEIRIAGWWLHALTVLAGYANPLSSQPDTFLDDDHAFVIGFNPWMFDGTNDPAALAWLGGDAVEDIAAFCQRQIDESYRRIARDQNEEGRRFFVEKAVPTHVPRLLWQLYDGTREIVLVRDFRDMFCSMTAFDAKRNQNDFRREDTDMETFLVRMIRDFRRLVMSWEERRETALLVRYEDLILAPEETLRSIATYTGIESGPEMLASMMAAGDLETDQVLAHRTTATGAESIKRYRNDMSPALSELSLELGGDLLSKLGYDSA